MLIFYLSCVDRFRKLFVVSFLFFPGRDQYYRRLFFVGFCSGSTRRLNRKEVFYEKPGIEPATPGLQGE